MRLQPGEKRNRKADGTGRMWHILWEDGKLTVDVASVRETNGRSNSDLLFLRTDMLQCWMV
jgi:hypothetical protein